MGQEKLVVLAATRASQLQGGRVAMVATSDVTYGMFRMWEVQRSEIDYEVQVFHEIEKARNWLIPTQPKV